MERIRAHFGRLQGLLEEERVAEREAAERELEGCPIEAREAAGRSVSRLRVEGVERSQGGYLLLVLSREPAGEELAPFHAMDQGDNVRVTSATGQAFPGTLERVEEYRAWVAFDGAPAELPSGGRCVLDRIGSDATYRRMKKALAAAAVASGRSAELRDTALGLRPAAAVFSPEPRCFNARLNEFQREAVRRVLGAGDFALVHGPPGTGKTTVLAEIIRQALERGERVLAGAPSNVAVDNLLEKLDPGPAGGALRVVRLGHPARTLESLRRANVRVQAAEDEQFESVKELEALSERLERKLERTGRGALAGEERRSLQEEVRRLRRQARELELAISRRIILSAQVVLSTHGGLSRHLLRGTFDLVVLDEASQATEPLSWIALLQGARAVLAGDAMQLPPTLHSESAARAGLATTLFERLEAVLPPAFQAHLRVQYRMHEAIMDFPSRRFYGGRLIADGSVRGHSVQELPGTRLEEWARSPLFFVDTSGTGFEERFNAILQSRENPREAELTAFLVRRLLEGGLGAQAIGVLSPYAAQVRLLKSLLRVPGLEIGTVDGFQGREKEAIVLSWVRSNDKGEVGFLADTRRMNVAITRARRLLVAVGDGATLARHPDYRAYIEHAEKLGGHRSAWEFDLKQP